MIVEREIPLYFESVILDSPIEHISVDNNPNVYRLKVRVFTKYANRNGSYITEEVANQLINSATRGLTPVIGFFDPETQSWASHTGPTLANAYGYVDSFVGWEPFTDTDGVSRDYAVFSVTLFTEYFEEANKIIGQNQSMELDPNSITGDWAEINNEYYYVYKTAKMLGFCVIGAHEPCFSVSAFFSKDEEVRATQLQEISSLLFDLKNQVEKKIEGGELPMDEFENNSVEQPTEEPISSAEPEVEFAEAEKTPEESTMVEEPVVEPSEFEVLQNKFNELNEKFEELNVNYDNALNKINDLEKNAAQQVSDLQAENASLKEIAAKYEALVIAAEAEKKNSLIEKYEKLINEEEIDQIREKINDFSYDELESKLAITFANKQMLSSDERKVPLPEPQESQFALLMKKYRK